MTDLKNITVNGVPVESYIVKKESDKKSFEIAAEHRAQQRVSRYHAPIRLRYKTQQQENSDTICLSNEQIRKEYGLMAKPLKTINENILWLIYDTAPISVNEILALWKDMGLDSISPSTMSARVSTIWNVLGNDRAGLISREKIPGTPAYRYELTETGKRLPFDEIMKAYKSGILGLKKKIREKRAQSAALENEQEDSSVRIQESSKPESDLKTKTQPEPGQEPEYKIAGSYGGQVWKLRFEELCKSLKQAEANAEANAEAGTLNINVSGGIKVTFEIKLS